MLSDQVVKIFDVKRYNVQYELTQCEKNIN